MKRGLSAVWQKTFWLLALTLLIACGGSEPEPVAEPAVQEEVAPVVVAESESEPTIVVASPVPPTAIPTDVPSPTEAPATEMPEPTEVVADVVEAVETVEEEPAPEEVAAEPVVEETFDPDADYAPPDFDAILASGKPIFINSYADW